MARSILIIEDETTLARTIQAFLRRHGYRVTTAADAKTGLHLWASLRPDVVLLDYRLGDANGIDVLRQLRTADPAVRVIVMTENGDVRVAVTAMKAGAVDCLTKPLGMEELARLLDRLFAKQGPQLAYAIGRRREAGYDGVNTLLGDSPPMRELRQRLRRCLDAEQRLITGEIPPAVLITGETGTGKEIVARALHRDGLRRERPFIELNCAALPAQLLEAELFGYERGAFTGANAYKPGVIELADGGMLFLDEVGELNLTLQAKLLRLLEHNHLRRLGGVSDYPINVRFVAATNQDLDRRVARGEFRADLLFRLRIIQFELPPLRDRRGDIISLALTFLGQHAKRYGRQGLRLSKAAQTLLQQHAWPGNVRELRNVIEQAVLLVDGAVVEPKHLLRGGQIDRASAPSAASPDGATLNLGRLELDVITRALRQTRWNVTGAARLLGISRDTLRYRIAKHALEKPVDLRRA